MKRFTSVLRSKRRKSSCGFGSDVEVASSHGTASTATEQRFYRSSASSQASSLGATSSASRSAPAKKHSRTPSALSTSPQEELKPLNTATATTSSLATIGTATSSEADGFGSPGSVISSPPKMRSMETSETTQTSLKFSTSKNSGHERSNISTTAQNYVGFANFPNQVFRRAIRNGFEFTLMVVGRSGLGKSTFMNTLFLAEVNDPKAVVVPPTGSTVKIDQKTVRLVENGVSLNLTLVDTPGFGGAIDNSKCWEPIQQFVDARYLEYLCEESKLERAGRVPDKCVHLCLYFIAPSGHGLDVIDVEFMKRLHDRVNIVPVIAKADTMTKDEIKRFKQQVLRDLDTHAIKVYKFPEPEDPEERRLIEPMRARVPFAVVGSNCVREETGGRKTRYREYPWGTVEVENMDHNDFMALRDMVIRTNMIDLIDVTHDVHYENFRVRQMGASVPKGKEDRDPFTAMEDERFQREKEIAEKKKNLDKVFDEKVREREQKIKGRTSKIEMREDEIARILEHKKAELDQLRNMVSELRRGNLHDSKTSVFSGNENAAGKTSPGEKVKKKTGTLGLFTRN